MRYPEFLPEKGTIGLVAPSFGVSGFPYRNRFDLAKEKLEKKGHAIIESGHLFGIEKAASADGKTRAEEFMDMYERRDVDFVSSVAGGELMCQMLPYVDFERIRKDEPKWFMGLSDNTHLTYTLPVLCDVAAMYGYCFSGFGMRRWHRSFKEAYEIMRGQRLSQEGYKYYEKKTGLPCEPGHEFDGFNLKKKTEHRSLSGHDERFSGRLIGGCLDVLVEMCGTKYDKSVEFCRKYKDDGILWYLEACDLNVLSISRALWQLREAGWFENVSGIIIGRPVFGDELFGLTYEEMLRDNLGDLGVPVVYGCDFGHVAPNWCIISGSIGNVSLENGECRISYELR